MNCHAVPTLSHGMVGMALEVAATPASAVAGTNCGEEDAQQPVDGRELETRVSITGYLASMIRYDNGTIEDTSGSKPDELDVFKINPFIDETLRVREIWRDAIGPNRQVIKTGTDDTMENIMHRITGARLAYQGETENVTMRGQENFRTKVISKEESDTPGSSLAMVNLSSLQTNS